MDVPRRYPRPRPIPRSDVLAEPGVQLEDGFLHVPLACLARSSHASGAAFELPLCVISPTHQTGVRDAISFALAQEFRLAIRPDSHPEAGHFYRSDHFSLARVGIPAFSINEGVKYKGHDAAWGMQQAREYTEKHYHQPSDEYHADSDFTGDAVMTRFGFALGWEAASLPKVVGWQKGDEFEAARINRGTN